MRRTVRICAAILALSAPLDAFAQGGPAAVYVDAARTTEMIDSAPVIGRLVANMESAVAARAEGVVAHVSVEIGDEVKAGEELARLDVTLHEIELQSARAALRRAESGVDAAEAAVQLRRQGLERAGQLQGSTAFSRGQFEDRQQELLEAEGQFSRAVADVDSAKAAMARAEYSVTHSQILAPFSGVVLERMVNPGQYISTGETVARLLSLHALEIEADVPSEYLASMRPGLDVAARTAAGEEIAAKLRAVIPLESVDTRTRAARFSFDADQTEAFAMAPGATVTVHLPVSAAGTVITASKDALVQGQGGWVVYVVQDGAAQLRPVTIGAASGARIEILSGLEAGEWVVVRGNERLLPGQEVTPIPIENTDPEQQG